MDCSRSGSSLTDAHRLTQHRHAEFVRDGLHSLEQALSTILEHATSLCEELQRTRFHEQLQDEIGTANDHCDFLAEDVCEEDVPLERSPTTGSAIVLRTITAATDGPTGQNRIGADDGEPLQRKGEVMDDVASNFYPRASHTMTDERPATLMTTSDPTSSVCRLGVAAPSTPLTVWTSVVDEEMVASQWRMMTLHHKTSRRSNSFAAKFSSSEHHYALKTALCNWILHPLSSQRMFWDVTSVLLMAVDIVLTPLHFAFGLQDTGVAAFLKWFRACYWTLDIFMSFRTGYVRSSGRVEKDPWLIAKKYVKTWFILDAGIVSLEWFASFHTVGTWGVLNAWRFNRLINVARAARVVRLAKIPAKLYLLSENLLSGLLLTRLVFSMLKMAAGFMIMVHLLSCGWFFVGQSDKSGWVYDADEGVTNGDLVQQYMSSARWVLAQVNGRTDQKYGRTMREQMYVAFCGIVAVLVMSLLISALTTRMVELQRLLDGQKKDMRLLNNFFNRNRSIAWSARHIAKHYVEARGVHHNKVEEEMEVLNMLPDALKQDLLVEMRSPCLMSHVVIRTISLFTTGHLIHALCKRMRPIVAASMTMIFLKDESCSNVIMVERGKGIYSQKGRLKRFVSRWLEETLGMEPGSMAYSYVASRGKLVKSLLLDGILSSSDEVDKWLSSTTAELTDDMQTVGDGAWLSEAALWVHWETRGDFLTTSNFTALAMESSTFQDIVRRHQELLPTFAVFAWAFIENAQDPACDSPQLFPNPTPALRVCDLIDESERSNLYDITNCPSPPMMGMTSP